MTTPRPFASVVLLLLLCCLVVPAAAATGILQATPTPIPPVIDGLLTDAVWQQAGQVGGFIVTDTGKPAPVDTTIYALSDTRHLYLGIRCKEPHPELMRAKVARDNGEVYGDDEVEFNFEPTGTSRDIFEVKMNSLGTKELLLRHYGHLDTRPLRVKAHVGAGEWTLELALPFSAAGIQRAPGVGMRWRVNFERLRTAGGFEDGYTWQPLPTAWDDPDCWGTLIIPGGPAEVTQVGWGRPQVGGRMTSRFTVSQQGGRRRQLELTVQEVHGGRAQRGRAVLPARGQAQVTAAAAPRQVGWRSWRWVLREGGKLLYSLQRPVLVDESVRATVLCHANQVIADISTRPWGRLPAGTQVRVELLRGKSAISTANAQPAGEEWMTAALPAGERPAGHYTVRATAVRGRRALGSPLVQHLKWPATAPLAGGRALNNLVTGLLEAAPANRESCVFTNPRSGWVFLKAEAHGGQASVRLDGQVVLTTSGIGETMRKLAAGPHTVSIEGGSGTSVRRLLVRAVPALVYCQFQADPHVHEQGPYDWAFLSKYVLPHCNTIIGGGDPAHRPLVEQWRRQGGEWFITSGVAGSTEQSITADEAERFWAAKPGWRDPLYNGIIVDEFGGGDDPRFAGWTEALRRMAADPQYAGKTFIPWCGDLYNGQPSRRFARAVLDAGWPLSWEMYLPEQGDPPAARALLRRQATEMRAWRAAQPGVEQHMIACLGYLAAPPESLDGEPAVDYKVWMDMQFRHLATDPAWRGLYGVQEYLSSYCDEEYVRWAGRLYRHYCIEGRTEPLTKDPYLMTHLRNPDFAGTLAGWTVRPAAPGTITTGRMPGYGYLEGRYPRRAWGDRFMVMRRSAERPNVVSQLIRGLEPGRLYSLRLFVGDRRDMSQQQRYALSVKLEGVVEDSKLSFVHVFPQCYGHSAGPYNDDHKAWMNYHYRVFRATARQATITISDWATPQEPGGPAGQELMVNFVQVQPYYRR